MSLATWCVGLLPPWSVIGLAAPLCLLGLPAAQAFSLDGEIGVAIADRTEVSPRGRQGGMDGW